MMSSLPDHNDGIVLTAELARLKLEDYSAVDFDQIVAIEPDAAEIIVGFGGGLAFERVAHLPDEIAIILSQHDALTFPSVTTFDGFADAALTALGERPKGYRAFNGVSHITPKQLRLLAAGNCFLELGGLTALSDELLEILAVHTGSLRLNGLQTLNATQARQLVGTSPAPRAHIHLDGLRTIDEQTAEVFGATIGTSFRFNGLQDLSPRVAAHLARTTGQLELEGLSSFTDEVAEALSHHAGTAIFLDGLPSIAVSAATALARHRGYLNLFPETESQRPRSLSSEVHHALISHRGAYNLDCITVPPLGPLTTCLALRSVQSDRMDGTFDDDLVGLGEEGAFSAGPGWGGDLIHLSVAGDDGIKVAPQFLALAHHLQHGAVTTLTARELLSWFGAQRRGKKVVDRIRTTIEAFRTEGFGALDSISPLLEADDLDLVHVFPPTSPVTGSFAEALRAPMTRLGYHIVDGDDDAVRFQTVLATGRRRMLTITRVASDPLIVRAEVSIALPDDASTLALAITTAHRLNRLSFVGRYRVDPIARTFDFDVTGAVRILSDLRTADAPTGVLPRLLSYAEAADLMMHRLLLDEPVHDPPERSIERIDHAEAAAELTGVAVEGSSLRVTTAIVLGPRPFNPEEGDEEPPRVVPETIGIVTRANTAAKCAKIYLTRDESEIESVCCEVAIIVTDQSVLAALAQWMNGHIQSLTTSLRQHLIEKGVLPKIDSVDEILASLEQTEEDEDENDWVWEDEED